MLIQAKCFPCMEAPRGYLTLGSLRLRCQRNGRVKGVLLRQSSSSSFCERDVWNLHPDGTLTQQGGKLLCYNAAYQILHMMEASTETNRACRLLPSAKEQDDSLTTYQLVTAEGHVIGEQHGGELVAVVTPEDESSAVVRFDPLHGELCYLTNAQFDQRICCDILGRLTAVDNRTGGWEIWRLVDSAVHRGAVQLRSWTHPKCLTSRADGTVVTLSSSHPTVTAGEHDWMPMGANPHGVVLRSVAHQRVLCMTNEGSFCTIPSSSSSVAADAIASLACRWTFTPANRNRFRILAGDRYAVAASLRSSPNNTDNNNKNDDEDDHVVEVATTSAAWNPLTMVKNQLALHNTPSLGWTLTCVDDEFVTIHQTILITTANDAESTTTTRTIYLSAVDDTVQTSPQPHLWTLEQDGNGRIALRSLYGQRLSCSNDGALSLQSNNNNDSCLPWTLVPCLPLAPTGRHVWTFAGAVGVAVAAPFAAVAVAEAVAVELAVGGALLGSAVATGAWVVRKSNNNNSTVLGGSVGPDAMEEEDDGGQMMIHQRPFVAWQEWST